MDNFERMLRSHALRVKDGMASPFQRETEELLMTYKNTHRKTMLLVAVAPYVCCPSRRWRRALSPAGSAIMQAKRKRPRA